MRSKTRATTVYLTLITLITLIYIEIYGCSRLYNSSAVGSCTRCAQVCLARVLRESSVWCVRGVRSALFIRLIAPTLGIKQCEGCV